MVQTTLASLWANATLGYTDQPDFSAFHETGTCHIRHDRVTFYLSVFLCGGLVISYLPQIFRIVREKSSQGFSPWFLLLGATSSASGFFNVVALQWGIVRCCSVLTPGECAESLLGILQVGIQWLMFVSVSVLFLVYYPKELRYEHAISLPITDDQQQVSRRRTRKAGQKIAAQRASEASSQLLGTHLSATSSTTRPNKRNSRTDTSGDDFTIDSENSDLDSIDSHIVRNYGADGQSPDSDATSSDGETENEPVTSAHIEGSSSDPSGSKPASIFSRLVPSVWSKWKGSADPDLEHNRSNAGRSQRLQTPTVLEGAPRGIRRIERQRRAKLEQRRGPKAKKRKTEEWSLAITLAWVALFHFLFIASITLLLVTSLPTRSFPSPDQLTTLEHASRFGAFASSSRRLISRWAAFLGGSATLLAAGQYLPQIVYTARTRLVGSLSIPMMCLQVPGSAIFVYSLALQPGTNWSSLAAFMLTGVLQMVLLILCIFWRIRQHRAGIDDFGRAITTNSLP